MPRRSLHAHAVAAVLLAAVTAAAVTVPGAHADQPAARPRQPPPPPPPPPRTLPPAIAARLPPAGFLIAHSTDKGQDDWFAITRVDATGATELVRDRVVPDQMVWLDGHTLVTVTTDIDSDTTTVRRYVDGKADAAATVTVPPAIWKLPRGKAITDTRPPELWLGKAGALWLARCHTLKPRGIDDVCTGTAWVRVDGGPKPAAKAPGARRAGPLLPSVLGGASLPRSVKPPAGYAVVLRKVAVDGPDASDTVKGFACTGPDGAPTLWPHPGVIDWQFDVRPTKVTWLAATPPLFAVTGKATNPIAIVSTATRVFRACQPEALDDVILLGAGRRVEMTRHWQNDDYAGTSWTLYVDDVAIATLDGGAGGFQVAPAP